MMNLFSPTLSCIEVSSIVHVIGEES